MVRGVGEELMESEVNVDLRRVGSASGPQVFVILVTAVNLAR